MLKYHSTEISAWMSQQRETTEEIEDRKQRRRDSPSLADFCNTPPCLYVLSTRISSNVMLSRYYTPKPLNRRSRRLRKKLPQAIIGMEDQMWKLEWLILLLSMVGILSRQMNITKLFSLRLGVTNRTNPSCLWISMYFYYLYLVLDLE